MTDVLENRTAPSSSVKALAASWAVEPLDVANAQSLRAVNKLLVVQPQRLSPAELVALDAWVRRGGHMVILADPDLRWPQQLPIGDPRRAPDTSLLSPLYRHWGLDLVPDAQTATPRMVRLSLTTLALRGSGHWVRLGGTCDLLDPAVAECPLGRGRAVLIADADFMQPVGDAAAQLRAIAAINQLLEDKNQ